MIRDKSWAERQNMGGLLNVSKGSSQPLSFLEINYSGGHKNDSPIVLVGEYILKHNKANYLNKQNMFYWLPGKGVTFDSGGISIKPSTGMSDMRADMMGASNVVAAISAIAELKIPINVIGEFRKTY